MVRIAATAFIILLFLGIGLFFWNKQHLAAKIEQSPSSASQIIKIEPKPVSVSISLTGTFEPLHVVNITSPFAGRVDEIYAGYGDIVHAGQRLLKMDTSELELKLGRPRQPTSRQKKTLKGLKTGKTAPM